MAGTNLQDNAITQASIKNGFFYIVQKDIDGANPSGTDILGATAGQVYKFYDSVGTGSMALGIQTVTEEFSDAGRQIGAKVSNKRWGIKVNVRGITLNMLKVLCSDGIYWKVGHYIPNKTGYMKFVYNLCIIRITGEVTLGNEVFHDYEVTIYPVSLETATVDAAGVGEYVVTPTEIAKSAVIAIASATDV